MRFDLSDEEWAIIEPLLPLTKRGPDRGDDRRVLTVFSTFCERVRRGGIYLNATVRARLSITVMHDGPGAASGAGYLRLWPRPVRIVCCSSMLHHQSPSCCQRRKRGSWRRISAAHAEAAQAKFTLQSMKKVNWCK